MFGKTQRGVSERPNKPKKPLVPTWLGILVAVLLSATTLIAVTLIWEPWEPVKPRGQVSTAHDQEEANQEYRFYDLLPKQQVTPIPEQAVPEIKTEDTVMIVELPERQPSTNDATTAMLTPSEEVKPSYILQVRSYKDPDSADARRAEIILNGLSADILVSMENGETWYRVISGPYESPEAAVIAQQNLQNGGIDSIVVKR